MSVSMRDQLIAENEAKAVNAARRNKPTMWAYHLRMATLLRQELDADSDGGVAGQALAISQRAESRCAELPPDDAADLWALGVYCRRILKAWCPRPYRVSLQWLKERTTNPGATT